MGSNLPIEPNTLVYANYTAKVKDTGELIETTLEEEAKKLGTHDPSMRYEPRLISVGEGWVLKGLDEALAGASVGDKLTVELPPEKAFGVRDPAKVRALPLRKLGEKADQLSVGEEIEYEQRIGVVRFIGSGRAQIDFNHKFAGKTLAYDVEILSKLENDEDKASALIRRRLPIEQEKLSFKIENSNVEINIPNDYYLVEGLQIIKRAISNDIFKFMKSVSSVIFAERYESPKKTVEEKKEEKKEEKAEKLAEKTEDLQPEKKEAPPTKPKPRKKTEKKALKKDKKLT